MNENLILTYNLASLKMIRGSLHVFAMEAEDELAQMKYHESMMKIDEIIHTIDMALKNRNLR
ncbi:DUF1657 domain-containing protein [Bacillus tianshenii]|uniref:DUF1657 domain-containing protein n=1 Tax=Sutcliffiella tianshenii TaxID=1463404 RepID=UPI001CD3F336|nr:DUF1657 domain-containing protein [Bacillus tianshenii]MCA1320046.1 DUF1657 domain-containing protein [Bacillus tianshenii]